MRVRFWGTRGSLPVALTWRDVRDRLAVARLFMQEQPELVFHAAALKHVPMVEANPCEGVRTNVLGTRTVADAARRAGAVAFVQVSTDKAVVDKLNATAQQPMPGAPKNLPSTSRANAPTLPKSSRP